MTRKLSCRQPEHLFLRESVSPFTSSYGQFSSCKMHLDLILPFTSTTWRCPKLEFCRRPQSIILGGPRLLRMMLSYLVYSVSLLIFVTAPAMGTPAGVPTNPLFIPQILNATLPNASAASNLSRPSTCTSRYEWFIPSFVQDDCKAALEYLWFQELGSRAKANPRQEFLAKGARASTHYKRQPTPRKYIFGEPL